MKKYVFYIAVLLFVMVMGSFVTGAQVNNPYAYNSLKFPSISVNVSNSTVNDTLNCDGIPCDEYWLTNGSNGPATGTWEMGDNNITGADFISTTTFNASFLIGTGGPSENLVFLEPEFVGIGTSNAFYIEKFGTAGSFKHFSSSVTGSGLSLFEGGTTTLTSLVGGISNSLTISSIGSTFDGITHFNSDVNITGVGPISSSILRFNVPDSEGCIDQNTFFSLDQFFFDSDCDGDGSGFFNFLTGDDTNFNLRDQQLVLLASGLPSFQSQLTDTSVNSGNILVELRGMGLDSDLRTGAVISYEATASWGVDVNDAPTEINFFTQSSGGGNDLATPRFTIESDGDGLFLSEFVIRGGDLQVDSDTFALLLGDSQDTSQLFDGTDMITELLVGSTAKATWVGFAEYVFDNLVSIVGDLNVTGDIVASSINVSIYNFPLGSNITENATGCLILSPSAGNNTFDFC